MAAVFLMCLALAVGWWRCRLLQAQADQEKRLAERLQRERQHRESVAPGTGLMGIKHAKVMQLNATPALTKKAKAKRQAKGQAKRPRYVAVPLPA
jgi:hypothetical protein